MGIHSGEQGRTRWAAAAGVIELGKPDTFTCETIKVGRLDLATIAADIAPAHVIGHCDDDVGPFGGERSRRQGQPENPGQPPTD